MKKVFILVAIAFVSFNAISQRDSVDAKNIEKANEIHAKVVPLLTGEISNEDITILGSFLYDNRPKNANIFFFSIFNPHLDEMIKREAPVDNTYITQAFRGLEGKRVKIELVSVIDFHEALNPAYKKSAYTLSYIISFKNDNSFGKNMDNFIDFRIDVIDSEIVNIGHQINKL